MSLDQFEMERMRSIYRHRVEYDLSESHVSPSTIAELSGDQELSTFTP